MLLSAERRHLFTGAFSGMLANVLLGFSSVFWKYLSSLNAVVLVSYRVFLSLLTVFLILCAIRGLALIRLQLNMRLLLIHAVAAILIAINWGVFIWASIHGNVLESGLGYLIAPVLSIAVGVIVYKESVTMLKVVAVSIILISVSGLLMSSSDLDARVYLAISITWGFYACLKKLTSLNVFSGLLLESAMLSMVCSLFLVFSSTSMALPIDFNLYRSLMLFSCGLISIIPLALFSFAAKRLTVTSMGLLQFVLPVTQFFVAAIIYRQSASPATLVVFLTVVCALLLVIFEPVIKKILRFIWRVRDGA